MLEIPYIQPPDDYSCALASHAMVASYFNLHVSIDEVAIIVDWHPGKAVWGFKFWDFLLQEGITITDYDLIDYEAWALRGLTGLKESVPKEEYDFYLNATHDIHALSALIPQIFDKPGFVYVRRKPTFADLQHAIAQGAVCEVVLDARALDGKTGFSLHRVVVLEVTDSSVVFHDPRPVTPRAARVETVEHFCRAWLSAVNAPELCVYAKR